MASLFVLGTKKERYQMKSAVAFGIFIFIVGYFIARSENKEKAKELQIMSDELSKAREGVKMAINVQAVKHGANFTDQQLDWVCSEVESGHGKEGLIMVKERLESASENEARKLLGMIETGYVEHQEELEITRLKNEADRKWQAVLDNFKMMNSAQRKKHLAYIKKNVNELSEEQLHILELISLGDDKNPSEADVLIGNTKLFTIRKR